MQINNFIIKPSNHLSAYNAKEEYKKLFFEFYIPLVRFANMIIKETFEAENIVSEVFIQVWKNRNNLSVTPEMKVFLYSETKKASLNQLQQERSKIDINDQSVAWSFPFNPSAVSSMPPEIFKGINEIVTELPAIQKIIFKLIAEDKLTTKQVAAILDLSHAVTERHFVSVIKQIGESLKTNKE